LCISQLSRAFFVKKMNLQKNTCCHNDVEGLDEATSKELLILMVCHRLWSWSAQRRRDQGRKGEIGLGKQTKGGRERLDWENSIQPKEEIIDEWSHLVHLFCRSRVVPYMRRIFTFGSCSDPQANKSSLRTFIVDAT
jgi:hypothetical protein